MSCEFVCLVRGGKGALAVLNEVFAWRNAAASRSREFMSAPCRSGRLQEKLNVDEVKGAIISCAAHFFFIYLRGGSPLVLALVFSSLIP